eukprot:CAMPEP_0205855536 /NCGR_PEP_ID=MMETSP1083-20121108/2656_1 /ASSEMBLY_ACC=CAM_ASM_000430 /TAXON_ID=97485 /ORGANISM="Prymnesium parvum, Strain Texoma1" /LENGTH=237 /DNA_ID=CAMNT_0053216915 /DNA_START=232 /DNA_END=942 /DNA_ORIENTATION=+
MKAALNCSTALRPSPASPFVLVLGGSLSTAAASHALPPCSPGHDGHPRNDGRARSASSMPPSGARSSLAAASPKPAPVSDAASRTTACQFATNADLNTWTLSSDGATSSASSRRASSRTSEWSAAQCVRSACASSARPRRNSSGASRVRAFESSGGQSSNARKRSLAAASCWSSVAVATRLLSLEECREALEAKALRLPAVDGLGERDLLVRLLLELALLLRDGVAMALGVARRRRG